MKSKLLTGALTLFLSFLFTLKGVSQSEKAEEIIKQMEAAGKLKRMGNTLEFQMDKPSDTMQVRKKYENVFKKPDGSNYEIKFSINTKYIQNNKQVPVNNLPTGLRTVVNQMPVNETAGNCCFCNIKTFGYIGVGGTEKNPQRPFTEHNWTVPAGVTKIKLEGWSAGGNGWSEIFVSNTFGTDTIYDIRGGGGGGGVYVLSFVSVKAGDVLKIRIPGGGSGSPLIVQFTETGIGTLNVESGHNGRSGYGAIRFDGVAGRLNMNSGLFSENTFSLRGTDGDQSWLSDYKNENNVTPGAPGPLSAPQLRRFDTYNVHGGDGGNAAKSVNGGRGIKFMGTTRGTENINAIAAKDGGYPGGGGGSGSIGIRNPAWRNGNGAPGLLIIYY